MKKEMIALFFLATLSISLLSGCVSNTNNTNGAEIHDFYFTLLNGSVQNLSDYRGKVVLVDMWSTWCGPCMIIMPELKKIHTAYNRTELEIISINIDTRETVELIESYISYFAEQYGIELNWIFARDDGSVAENYLKDGAIPTLAIFDQVGQLYYHEVGIHGYTEVPYGYPSSTPLLAPVLNGLI